MFIYLWIQQKKKKKKVGTGNTPHSKSRWKDYTVHPTDTKVWKNGGGAGVWRGSRSTKNYLKKIKGNTGKNKLSQRLHLLKENQNLEFAPNEQVENIKTYNKLHFSTI